MGLTYLLSLLSMSQTWTEKSQLFRLSVAAFWKHSLNRYLYSLFTYLIVNYRLMKGSKKYGQTTVVIQYYAWYVFCITDVIQTFHFRNLVIDTIIGTIGIV